MGGGSDAARRVWPAAWREAGRPTSRRAPTQLKGMSASAGRRITTVSIETSDPVAYVTSRPDPLTLFIDLRDVDASGARSAVLGAKGIVSGAAVEQATGADGARVARVRIRLTHAAAHQVRSKRNIIHVDFDSAFPLGSVGNASPSAAAHAGIVAVRDDARERHAPSRSRPAPAITLTGNGELVVESVTPFGDGTPRVVLSFPNVRSQAPADVFVGRGPVAAVHVGDDGRRADDTRHRRSAAAGDLSRHTTGGRRKGLHDSLRGRRAAARHHAAESGWIRGVARSDRCAADPRRDWRGRCAGRGDRGRDEGASAHSARRVRLARAAPDHSRRYRSRRHSSVAAADAARPDTQAAVYRTSGDARFPGRGSADGAAHVRRHQRAQHRHRSVGAGRGRRLAARSAVGSGARHHPAGPQARLFGRGNDRPDRAAHRAVRRRSAAPQARRRARAVRRSRSADASAELREGERS